jgi:hypothetical protein
VSVACYSDYLSQRDRQAFQALFDALEVDALIHYGTFNALCEALINSEVDLRAAVTGLLLEGKGGGGGEKERRVRSDQVLLVDEVDVLFGESFFGNVYVSTLDISPVKLPAFERLDWRGLCGKPGARCLR